MNALFLQTDMCGMRQMSHTARSHDVEAQYSHCAAARFAAKAWSPRTAAHIWSALLLHPALPRERKLIVSESLRVQVLLPHTGRDKQTHTYIQIYTHSKREKMRQREGDTER